MTTPHLPTPRAARPRHGGYSTTVSIFPAEWHCTTAASADGEAVTVCERVVRMPVRWYYVAEERDE